VLVLAIALVGICLLGAAYITLQPSYDATFGELQGVRSPYSTGVYALYVGGSVLVHEIVMLLQSNRLPLYGVMVSLLSLLGAGNILLVMTLPLPSGER
jgi:hypothetical protein